MSDSQNPGSEIAEEYEEDWNRYCGFLVNDADKGTYNHWRSGTKRWFNWCAENDVDARTAIHDEVVDYICDTNHLADHTRASAFDAVVALYQW